MLCTVWIEVLAASRAPRAPSATLGETPKSSSLLRPANQIATFWWVWSISPSSKMSCLMSEFEENNCACLFVFLRPQLRIQISYVWLKFMCTVYIKYFVHHAHKSDKNTTKVYWWSSDSCTVETRYNEILRIEKFCLLYQIFCYINIQ